MDFRTLKKLNIGGIDLVELFINGIRVWKSGPKNWVKYSTEADGVTIYNGGLGYKNGYRIRSGGAEGALADASHTGFIPAFAGDVLGLGGATLGANSVANAINVYNASRTNIGQIVENAPTSGYGIFGNTSSHQAYCWNSGTIKDGCFYWTVPPDANIAYVRVTGQTGGDGSKMIITINEEIE